MFMKVTEAKFLEGYANHGNHYHDHHQLLYIKEGVAEVLAEGKKYEADGGTLLIFSRFEHHSVKVKSECYKRFTLHIAGESEGNDRDLLYSVLTNRSRGFSHAVKIDGFRSELETLLHRLTEENDKKSAMWENMQNLLINEIFILLYRSAPEIFTDESSENIAFIEGIKRDIEADFGERLTLSALAARHNISPSHLSHLFKEVSGYAPMEYLQNCRITAAKRLLANTDLPVNEIVFTCGFSDGSNFSRTFKRQTGVSPTEFRKKYKKQ